MRLEIGYRSGFVLTHEARIAGDIGGQDGDETSLLEIRCISRAGHRFDPISRMGHP